EVSRKVARCHPLGQVWSFSEHMGKELAFLPQMRLETFFGGRVLGPNEPEGLQRLNNSRRVYPVSVCFSLVIQIGHNGCSLLPGENRKTISRVVGKGHSSVSLGIHEGRSAPISSEDARVCRYLDGCNAEPGQMEQRLRGQKFFLQIGNQIGRKEKAKSPLGEKTESAGVSVEQSGL